MRKIHKKQVESFIETLGQAHEEIRRFAGDGNYAAAMDLLGQCQEGAVRLGELIEKTEGEDTPAIPRLEEYCELVYEIYQELAENQDTNAGKIYKKLRKSLIQIENSVRNNIRIRYEVAFLPYKASMWDSLESVWRAAEEDEDCDAYVVPIPYYNKYPDGTLGTCHYEGSDLPEDVPVTSYHTYSLKERRPDAIFIHNPYDYANYVTSIDPEFYSEELKKYTNCLIYIPYYSTSGGMSDGQRLCPAYYNADYIVIQAEKYRGFFDSSVPQEKFLPLGSPKFDRVIQLCNRPPEPPAEWKEKMAGKKVYFYNTSLNGMLENTDAFLKKMRYVFDVFKGRKDACLLWRPHPLMESTFESLRKGFKARYDALKTEFINENEGIYDDTTDITNTIALSDVYIGDAGTSVTSLFGVAGKPLFIFNNLIDSAPQADDWRGEKITPAFDIWGKGDERFFVTVNNQLWFSEKNDFHYKFYMDLGTGYSGGGYYLNAVGIKDKIYVIPGSAQHLLIIKNKKIKKIDFGVHIPQGWAFYSYYYDDKYIFLYPSQYPLLIRFDIETEQLQYVDGIRQFNVRNVNGEWRIGGACPYGKELVFASPVDNQFLFLDKDTLEIRTMSSHSACNLGSQIVAPDGDDLWLMPLNGMTITCWNPKTGERKEYGDLPQNFKSVQWPFGYECGERPFGDIAIFRENGKETIIASPYWGNMYVSLDRKTGKMEEWKPPFSFERQGRNGYYAAGGIGGFMIPLPQRGKAECLTWHAPERKVYRLNIVTKECEEIKIEFDYEELRKQEPGFMEESEWMQYCLKESAFNSLENLLDGDITGNLFDRERQRKAFAKINADTDGTCGKNVYYFVKGKIS